LLVLQLALFRLLVSGSVLLPLSPAPSLVRVSWTTPPASEAAASTEEALRALAPRVAKASHPDALRTAFQAYFNHSAAHPNEVRKPYLYYVDLGLDNRSPRGYVFDMRSLEVIEGPFTVAHGNGSSASRDGVPTSFSNRAGSKASSLGLYVAEGTYTFRGKSAGRAYSSVGLRMRGESGEFNGAALRRGIVAHGAPYVTAARAGRSEGCPAMEPARAARLLPLLANGGVVFLYSPRDARWLRDDPWISGASSGD
jgi:hypothetical protein